MLVPAHRLITSLHNELSAFFSAETAEASAGQSVTSAVQLLQVRELGGIAFLHDRLDRLSRLLAQLAEVPSPMRAWADDVQALRAAAFEARRSVFLEELEAAWRSLLVGVESLLAKLIAAPSVAPTIRTGLTAALGAWEIADRRSMTTVPDESAGIPDTRVTRERIQAYLRDRFEEPALKLIKFQPLPGGFGKETILLEVEGRAVEGSMVMRRDPGQPTVDNDCHRVRNEYPVIRAAFRHGFPAPDALWLDTEHELLPGGDFIVMRRAAGQTGGSVFGATTGLSENLIQVLAGGIARLHALPPCVELGDLTDSIRADRWTLSLKECISRYIRGWYELYLREAHNPSPTLVSIYGWLFDNIPDAPGAPVLLHGDIGFHNMLVDAGRLSVLVDWEFAHIGDPAEDIGFVKNTSGGMPWAPFMDHYRAAGGADIDPVRLHFFQVWGQARNASASNLVMGKFDIGAIPDLKLAYTGHYHFPLFLKAACELIDAGPDATGAHHV